MTLTRRTVLAVFGLHVAVGLVFLAPRYIRPDSVGVYSWIRSIAVDGDLSFLDEWAGFRMITDGYTEFKELTPVGALANHWWPGAAILSSPAYLVSHLASLGLPGPWFPDDGFFGLDLFTLSWCSVLFAALAAILAWLAIAEIDPQDRPGLAALALLLTWLGTPLFWYAFRMPLGTHAAGAVMVGAFTLLVIRVLRRRATSGYLLGLALGLCALVRLQHAVLAFVLLWAGLRTKQPRRFWISALAGVSIPAMIQGLGWWAIYGVPLGPLVRGALGGSTWRPFQAFRVLPVLASPWHGLLSWSPVFALCFGGWMLLALARRPAADDSRRSVGVMLLLIFVLELVANSTLDRYWWGGLSFGPRRFVDLAAPAAVGLYVALTTRRRWIVIVLGAAATTWTVGLMVSAGLGALDLSQYVDWRRLAGAALVTPWSARLRDLTTPLSDPGALTLLVLSLALTGAVALGALQVQRRFGMDRGATAWLLLTLIAFGVAAARTPRNAAVDRDRFGVNTPAARVAGPLIDARSLVSQEVQWLDATGRREQAAAARAEIAAFDSALREVGVAPQ